MTDLVDIVFPDLLGLLHGKTVPAHRLDHPTHYAVTCMVQGLDLNFLETEGYSTGAGFPDMEARIDPDTTRPWLDGRQTAMAYLYRTDGQPLPFDSRRQLTAVCDRWEALGYTPVAGFEMEFFLLEQLSPMTRLAVPDHRVYGVGAGADPSGTLEEIGRVAELAQLQVEGMNSEFTPGQVEAALHYRPALAAADGVLLFREITRAVARSRGIDATFMPRPFDDTVGSGMHVNLSMTTTAGDNAFDDPGGPRRHQRPREALHRGPAPPPLRARRDRRTDGELLQATLPRPAQWLLGQLGSSTTGSPRCACRASGARPPGSSIESPTAPPRRTSSPRPCSPPACTGSRRGCPCPPPQTGDADAAPNTDRHTPHSLAESLDALAADEVLFELMDRELLEAFIGLKREENQRWLRAVTDWEQREYGRVY